MATPFDLECSIPIGNEGDSSADTVAVFTEALKLATAGVVDLTAGLVAPPTGVAFDRCKAGTNNFSYGNPVASGLPGSILLYTHSMGFECPEWISWWFKGGGEALVDGLLLAADATNPYLLPVLTRGAEGGGWFKESVTLKKFEDGLWSNGSQISLRQFGESQPAMNAAFPNILTPPATTGISFLGDVQGGVWNGGEYNEPFGDAAVINGLFPNWPSGQGGIIEAGLKHYYVASWHSPSRMRPVWVNRTYWAGLSADDQKRLRYAAMASALENVAISYQGQDALIKNFQALGATIHQFMPRNVVLRLREALTDAQDANAAADGTGAYQALLDHQRAFMRANHIRWGASTEDRRMRFQRNKYAPILVPDA
jgi:TRAP-type mannitol/chloroaromatic compound transport system substrate-binding protein